MVAIFKLVVHRSCHESGKKFNCVEHNYTYYVCIETEGRFERTLKWKKKKKPTKIRSSTRRRRRFLTYFFHTCSTAVILALVIVTTRFGQSFRHKITTACGFSAMRHRNSVSRNEIIAVFARPPRGDILSATLPFV